MFRRRVTRRSWRITARPQADYRGATLQTARLIRPPKRLVGRVSAALRDSFVHPPCSGGVTRRSWRITARPHDYRGATLQTARLIRPTKHISAPVKPHRVIDQERLLERRGRGYHWNII